MNDHPELYSAITAIPVNHGYLYSFLDYDNSRGCDRSMIVGSSKKGLVVSRLAKFVDNIPNQNAHK